MKYVPRVRNLSYLSLAFLPLASFTHFKGGLNPTPAIWNTAFLLITFVRSDLTSLTAPWVLAWKKRDVTCLSWTRHKMTVYVVLCTLSINRRTNGISLGLESCQNILAHTISSSLCAPVSAKNASASNIQLSFKGLQHTIESFYLPHINTSQANEVYLDFVL